MSLASRYSVIKKSFSKNFCLEEFEVEVLMLAVESQITMFLAGGQNIILVFVTEQSEN